MDFIRLGSVTTNRKNGLTGEQLAVGTDSRSVSTEPSRMFSVLTEGCHVGYSREFVGTVYCPYGQSNTTNVQHFLDNIFKLIFLNENVCIFIIQLYRNLFPSVQSLISQHWFRKWLGTKQVTSHDLIQSWPRSMTPHGVTRPQWVNYWKWIVFLYIFMFSQQAMG